MQSGDFGFTRAERAVFRKLSSPEKIQRFLDTELGYDRGANGWKCRSPRNVLREGTAQCVDGAIFGAAALRLIGHPPLLLDLEAVRDDDHVLAIFRLRRHWGAIAKSNYAGLRFRESVYRTLRELVMSYFEHYYNPAGEKTRSATLVANTQTLRFNCKSTSEINRPRSGCKCVTVAYSGVQPTRRPSTR